MHRCNYLENVLYTSNLRLWGQCTRIKFQITQHDVHCRWLIYLTADDTLWWLSSAIIDTFNSELQIRCVKITSNWLYLWYVFTIFLTRWFELTLSPPNKLLSAEFLFCFNIQSAQSWWKCCLSVKQLGCGWDAELLCVSSGSKLFTYVILVVLGGLRVTHVFCSSY